MQKPHTNTCTGDRSFAGRQDKMLIAGARALTVHVAARIIGPVTETMKATGAPYR